MQLLTMPTYTRPSFIPIECRVSQVNVEFVLKSEIFTYPRSVTRWSPIWLSKNRTWSCRNRLTDKITDACGQDTLPPFFQFFFPLVYMISLYLSMMDISGGYGFHLPPHSNIIYIFYFLLGFLSISPFLFLDHGHWF